ncbi:hypothetical protein BDV93DRAFT_419443, partial [Ceratobasidium sp. AG-I]
WIDRIIVPHIERERERLKLPLAQRSVLLLDCWSVHRGKPFREWMRATHPKIIIVFVPGGCTGVGQPCDTGINRILKHRIKAACIDYLAKETERQLRAGVTPANVVLNTTVGTLRNASTGWLLSAW